MSELGVICFGFYRISQNTYFIIILSLIVTFLPSLFLPKVTKRCIVNFSLINVSKSNKIYLSIFLVIIFFGFLAKLKNGSIGSETFEKEYDSGIFAHLLILLSVFIISFLCFFKKTFFTVVCICLGLFFVFLSGVKYHILFIWLVFMLKLFYITNLKQIIKLVLIASIGIIFFFVFNYFVGLTLREGSVGNDFIYSMFKHFVTYVGGGIVAFSQKINNTLTSNNGYVFIDTLSYCRTNVFTLIGTYYIKYGYFSLIIIFFISLFSYFQFNLFLFENNQKKKRMFFLAYSIFTAVPFTFSFFSSYYGLSRIYEMLIYSYFTYILLENNFGKEIIQYKG